MLDLLRVASLGMVGGVSTVSPRQAGNSKERLIFKLTISGNLSYMISLAHRNPAVVGCVSGGEKMKMRHREVRVAAAEEYSPQSIIFLFLLIDY